MNQTDHLFNSDMEPKYEKDNQGERIYDSYRSQTQDQGVILGPSVLKAEVKAAAKLRFD